MVVIEVEWKEVTGVFLSSESGVTLERNGTQPCAAMFFVLNWAAKEQYELDKVEVQISMGMNWEVKNTQGFGSRGSGREKQNT